MHLYVISKSTGKKHRIGIPASSRSELARRIGSSYFLLKEERFSVLDVCAAEDQSIRFFTLFLCGIVGLVFGPLGVIGGFVIGVLYSTHLESEDRKKVADFNYKLPAG